MAMRAVGVTRFASGRLGLGLGRSLPERRRLAFAGPQRPFESPGQVGDLFFQFGHALEQRAAMGHELPRLILEYRELQ